MMIDDRITATPAWSFHLSNEVHNDQMQNDVCENKVSKGSFRTDAEKLILVGRVGLDSEAHSKNKWSYTWDETSQEWVEGEGANHATVQKLEGSCQEDIQQVGVDQLDLCRCSTHVLIVEFSNNTS